MDYKELIPTIKGYYFDLTVQDSLSEEQLGKLRNDLWDMETAITDLLARAEAAEARAEKAESERDQARQDCAVAERNHMIEVERRKTAENERDALKARFCAEDPCKNCNHYASHFPGCDDDCLKCQKECPCNQCCEYSMWEWNGKKEE